MLPGCIGLEGTGLEGTGPEDKAGPWGLLQAQVGSRPPGAGVGKLLELLDRGTGDGLGKVVVPFLLFHRDSSQEVGQRLCWDPSFLLYFVLEISESVPLSRALFSPSLFFLFTL